ncbi:MAG: 2-phospho-L-lactate guanylyltransferase [Anaerolineales bacterium]
MTIWAIVPVKPLRRSKSRLAHELSRDERALLSQRLLIHTLRALRDVQQIDRTLVVSRDSHALALARDFDARTVTERGHPQLNQALERATYVAQGYGVSSVLVLPADLPLLTSEDIEKFIEPLGDPPVVVIAADRKGVGTNALLVSPPGLIKFRFGPDSFAKHGSLAREAGARLEVCNLPNLGLDLDEPEDLTLLQEEHPHAFPLKEEDQES